MTKAGLITAVAGEGWVPADHVEAVLDALARVASKELGEGGEVTIPGIAKLTTRERAARKGRHPVTGAPIDIPAKTVVKVRVVKALADRVAG